jgi:hypothetical protein
VLAHPTQLAALAGIPDLGLVVADGGPSSLVPGTGPLKLGEPRRKRLAADEPPPAKLERGEKRLAAPNFGVVRERLVEGCPRDADGTRGLANRQSEAIKIHQALPSAREIA